MVLRKFIGDRSFYKYLLGITVPVMIQNGITNFVSLLDNIMVGNLGTEQMSGVSIVNQFIFVFNLLIFGAVSAAGIFMAQYHGQNDDTGKRYTFRFKLYISLAAAAIGVAILYFCDVPLISMFLHGSDGAGDLAKTLEYGRSYLFIMLTGLIPYSLSQVYASSMRETGETTMPMIASFAAVGTNCVLNYILIFGKFGAPALGVRGAAIATVVSRVAESVILIIWAHRHSARFAFLKGAFRSFHIPRSLMAQIAVRGLPLMANELLWAFAMTVRNQSYSMRGLDAVAALNISTTYVNVLSVVYQSLGTAIAIIIGNILGSGDLRKAKDWDTKMMAFSVACGAAMGLLLTALSGLLPLIYNTSDEVRSLAVYMMIVSAVIMPFCAFAHSAYFTMRSGGRVLATILSDSVYMWVIVVPLSYLLSHYTGMDIKLLFALTQSAEILKSFFGYFLLSRGTWLRKLV